MGKVTEAASNKAKEFWKKYRFRSFLVLFALYWIVVSPLMAAGGSLLDGDNPFSTFISEFRSNGAMILGLIIAGVLFWIIANVGDSGQCPNCNGKVDEMNGLTPKRRLASALPVTETERVKHFSTG